MSVLARNTAIAEKNNSKVYKHNYGLRPSYHKHSKIKLMIKL